MVAGSTRGAGTSRSRAPDARRCSPSRPPRSDDGYVAAVTDRLLFVTQVAPYATGPAGVHGVLDQAAVGVAQVAELHGLAPRRVDDVRALDAVALHEARALAL